MRDKEVGQWWRSSERMRPLIRKLVEERIKTRRFLSANRPRDWSYRELALRDFGIDPKDWSKKQ